MALFRNSNQLDKKVQSQNSSNTNFHSGQRVVGKPPGPPVSIWETYEELEFHREANTSYRLCFCSVNDAPYVSIAHWFFNSQQAKWFPTKSQIYLPAEIYLELLPHTKKFAILCNKFQSMPFNINFCKFYSCTDTSM